MMIDGLCQGYHWSFADAVKMTLPQVIMLNHAAHANSERMKSRVDSNTHSEPVDGMFMGKPVEELDENELDMYFRTFQMSL
jgi:hypothetical protein